MRYIPQYEGGIQSLCTEIVTMGGLKPIRGQAQTLVICCNTGTYKLFLNRFGLLQKKKLSREEIEAYQRYDL